LTNEARHIKFNHMVELQESRLNAVFHALGDGTRRRMLRRLAQGERTVGELAEPFQMSLAAASKHVKALEAAGLIRREIRGRVHLCRLEAGPLSTASEWLNFYERFWNNRLDRLEELLRRDTPPAKGVAVQPRTPRAAERGKRRAPSPNTPRKTR
jgi:DNA-binding transcriptional ArsR family regulator